MKQWRKLTGLTLSLCLITGFPAYATVQVSPLGDAVNTDTGSDTSVTVPEIQAEGAVVIDAATGNILYGKNENNRFYPASITKLMTAMLVLEHANLTDTVVFSKTATTNLESGAVSLNLTEGDQLTVEQCLYALLLKSANEVGNALAEHVSGSVSQFAELMNQKAATLGCTGTHFTNPHGLNDSNHYTTPYDMALIARAAFQNPVLCRINTSTSYQLPATIKEEARTIVMGHKMMYPEDSRYYEGIIGGKTGYTSLAGNTLVTGVERNGIRLIAVVMKSKATHYEDTRALLDYGFAVLGKNESTGLPTDSQQAATGPGATGPGVGGTGNGQSGTGILSPAGNGQSETASAFPAEESQSGTVSIPPTGESQPGAVPMPSTGENQPGTVPIPQTGENQPGTVPMPQTGENQPGTVPIPQTGENQSGTGSMPSSGVQTDTGTKSEGSASAQPAGTVPKGPGISAGQQPVERVEAGWGQDEKGWYYIKEDQSQAAGEWLYIDGTDYWIDSDGYMATGWRKFTNGDWYYFHSSGAMASDCWIIDNGKWFYLGSQGVMLSSTRTPDGYELGDDGAWIQ